MQIENKYTKNNTHTLIIAMQLRCNDHEKKTTKRQFNRV